MFSRDFKALLLTNIAFSFALSCFFLLPKYMAQQLHAGPSEIGALTTGFGITSLITVPLVGRLLDGSRDRAIVVAGCGLMALSALGFVWVDSFGPGLLALRCVQAVALSMFSNAGSVIVTDLAPRGRLAQALGLFAGTGMVMTAIAPAFVEWLSERGGYRPAFAVASAAAALGMALALRIQIVGKPHAARASLRRVLVRPSSLRMIAVLGCAGLGFGVVFAFSQPFALELGTRNVRGFFLAFAAAAVFVRVVLGGMIDRLGPGRVAGSSLFCYGAVVALMYFLEPGRLELLGALFGFSHGLFIPAFTAFIVGGAQVHERGKLMTLFNGAFNLGNCLVVLLGVAAERHGYPRVFAVTGCLIASAPLLLVGWPRHQAVGQAS
jgi:predicted MFS family arabinose efflux permease